ncbi:MAG: TIGR03086 family metal-binding protein [Acidimicrobiales bacterium]
MSGAIDAADAYQRAAALFGETIVGLSDDEWELPTGAEGWTVVTTVAWVVVGDSQLAVAAEGGVVGAVRDFDAAVLGTAPVAAWRGTAVGAIGALRAAGVLAGVVRHVGGPVAMSDLVGQRVSENLVRAWDIGRAVGRPVTIPDDLADWCLDFWAGHADAVLAGEVLPDAPIEPPAGASPAARLLALTGRA